MKKGSWKKIGVFYLGVWCIIILLPFSAFAERVGVTITPDDIINSFKNGLKGKSSQENNQHNAPGIDQSALESQENSNAPLQRPQESNVLEQVGLRNILPQFDENVSLSKQFPHVAITIVKSPPLWADNTMACRGCWKLKAVVWTDAKHSKNVGPFDWCLPEDEEIELGAMAHMTAPEPGLVDKLNNYTTGITRTSGPQPPNTWIPTDRQTRELFMKAQSNSHAHYTLSDSEAYASSAIGTMFANLRHQMGADLENKWDMRVWIVKIDQEDTGGKTKAKTTSGGLTEAMLKNGEYALLGGSSMSELDLNYKTQLKNGRYQYVDPIHPHVRQTVVLAEFALGDLNGDGKGDAAVILAESGGGSGDFIQLAAVLDNNGKPKHVDSAYLGDRTDVHDIRIMNGVITLKLESRYYTQEGIVEVHYRLQNNKLVGNNPYIAF